MNRHIIIRFLAVSCAYLLADGILPATAQTAAATAAGAPSATTALSPRQPNPATASQGLVAGYSGFAGSAENAASLVGGLRTGGKITLSGGATAGSLSFMPPTRPMGWGNVRHALSLAQRELAAQGIAQPTPEQLRAALMGGRVVNASGHAVTMPGILTQRSQGMGWGRIARSAGTTLGSAAPRPLSGHDGPAAAHPVRAAAAGHHGTITTASGEVARSGHWRGGDAIPARTEARAGGAMPASVQFGRPAAVTPVASNAGISTAGERGGFGPGGRGR